MLRLAAQFCEQAFETHIFTERDYIAVPASVKG